LSSESVSESLSESDDDNPGGSSPEAIIQLQFNKIKIQA
jgi:hypothetical protein